MLDPNQGRVTITEQGDMLRVVVPAKANPFVTGFIGFWMIGWAFGWVSALVMLVTSPSVVSVFIVGWLGAWTIGGIAAGSVLLWTLAGREIVLIDAHQITVTRRIPLWSRSVTCATSDIRALRTVEETPIRPRTQRGAPGLWSPRSAGSIRFDYGVHTIGFGLEVDPAEANQAVAIISERFPNLTRSR